MAMRIHLLAAHRCGTTAFQRHLQGHQATVNDWQVGMLSVWGSARNLVDWQAALLSRETAGVVLRCTTVDDSYLVTRIFRNGRPVFQQDLPMNGLLGESLTEALLDMVDEDAVEEDEEGFESADVHQPLSEEARAQVREEFGGDPLWDRIADGHTPHDAAVAQARAQAGALIEALAGSGIQVDPDRLGQALLLPEDPEEADESGAWQRTPEILEALGLTGFGAWLAAQQPAAAPAASDERVEDAAQVPSPAQAQTRQKKPSVFAKAGLFLCAGALVGGAAGAWLGGVLGGLLGATAGAGLIVMIGVVRLGLRLKRAAAGLTRAAKRLGNDPLAGLPAEQRADAARLMAAWNDIAVKTGRAKGPQGMLEGLYDQGEAAEDEVGKRMLHVLAEGTPVAALEPAILDLRDRLLDAELQGRPDPALTRDIRQFAQGLG